MKNIGQKPSCLSAVFFLQRRERCSHTAARMFKDVWENILPPAHMIGMTAISGPSLQRSFQPPMCFITLFFFNISWSLHRLFELHQGTNTGISSMNMSLESKQGTSHGLQQWFNPQVYQCLSPIPAPDCSQFYYDGADKWNWSLKHLQKESHWGRDVCEHVWYQSMLRNDTWEKRLMGMFSKPLAFTLFMTVFVVRVFILEKQRIWG